jgi:hypothetical protein
MTDLTLRDDLVQRLQQIASQEHRRLDEIVETMLDRYDPSVTSELVLEEERRQDRLRIYERARRYWRQHSDVRQQLSNEDLDEQFWVIDPDGIPRLKDEQSNIELPADPFVRMLEMAESDPTVQWRSMSGPESTKEVLNREYTDHLLARLNGTTTPNE